MERATVVAFRTEGPFYAWPPQDIYVGRRGGKYADGQPIEIVPGLSPERRSALLSSVALTELIAEEAHSRRVSVGQVASEAEAILDRIGDGLSSKTTSVFVLILRMVMRRLYTCLYVTPGGSKAISHLRCPVPPIPLGATEGLDMLRALPWGITPIIMVPTHRSYMDFLMASFLCYTESVPALPHIASGEDFLRLEMLSNVLRNSGAFFMRRSFKGSPIYSLLFRSYVQSLVLSGEPIEFFVEGTRSRTGKMLSPKYGILKMIVEAAVDPTVLDAVPAEARAKVRERALPPFGATPTSSDIAQPEEVDPALGPVKAARTKPRRMLGRVRRVEERVRGSRVASAAASARSQAAALPEGFAGCTDVLFVPFSFSYDRLLEAGGYARELHGAAKPPETVGNLLRAVQVLRDSFGAVHLHLSTPISLAATALELPPFTRSVDASPHYDVTQLTVELGSKIAVSLEKGLLATSTALFAAVCLYLHSSVEFKDSKSVPTSELAAGMEWLRSEIAKRGGKIAANAVAVPGSSMVYDATTALSAVVSLSKRSNSVSYIVPDSSHVHMSPTEGIVTPTIFGIYAAGILHHFVLDGIRIIAAKRKADPIWIGEMLTTEFPVTLAGGYPTRSVSPDVAAALSKPVADNEYDEKMAHFASQIVFSYLEVCWLVALCLSLMGERDVRSHADLVDALSRVAVVGCQHSSSHPAFVSYQSTTHREVIRNALVSLEGLNVIKTTESVVVPSSQMASAVESKLSGLRWRTESPSSVVVQHIRALLLHPHAAAKM